MSRKELLIRAASLRAQGEAMLREARELETLASEMEEAAPTPHAKPKRRYDPPPDASAQLSELDMKRAEAALRRNGIPT